MLPAQRTFRGSPGPLGGGGLPGNDDHRARGVLQHIFAHALGEQVMERPVAVGTDNDQVGFQTGYCVTCFFHRLDTAAYQEILFLVDQLTHSDQFLWLANTLSPKIKIIICLKDRLHDPVQTLPTSLLFSP